MTRDVVLGLSVLSIALLACGGNKQRPASSEGTKVVLLVERDMGEKAYNMPAEFAVLSRKHGCQVDYKAERAISTCPEGVIGLGRVGSVVRVMCGEMTRVQCEHLFNAIAGEAN